MSVTPLGNRSYLGEISPSEPVTLTLSHLPAHQMARISFDLFLMQSWDGSSEMYGYARWDLGLNDGRKLIHTTFNNVPYFDNDQQAFPDSYPARSHRGWTLATETQTLGVMQNFAGQPYDVTSVYHFSLAFPHTDTSARFVFQSTMEQNQQKYYGLTNVKVETFPELPTYSPDEIAAFWNDLGSFDPKLFYKAQWNLIAAGEPAVDYISAHLDDPLPPLSEAEIEKLVPDLKNDWDVCIDSYDKIEFQGPVAAPVLTRALAGPDVVNPSLYHYRLGRLLGLVTHYQETPQQTRNFRAKNLLDAIHSPAAIELAKTIADVDPPDFSKDP